MRHNEHEDPVSVRQVDGWTGIRATVRLRAVRWLPILLLILLLPMVVAAQVVDPPVGSRLRVANTGGQGLNVRVGAGPSERVLTRLAEGAELEVVGAARAAGAGRWVEVREAGGQRGWVSLEFVAVVSTPAPTATPTPSATSAPAPAAASTPTATPPIEAVAVAATPTPTPTSSGGALDVEAKVKFPETSGRTQEITVWATRNGAPVPGVTVTAVSDDGEDVESNALLREFDPTDVEGKTSKAFTIRQEKGTVRVVITATAPDGGKGAAIVQYFRR